MLHLLAIILLHIILSFNLLGELSIDLKKQNIILKKIVYSVTKKNFTYLRKIDNFKTFEINQKLKNNTFLYAENIHSESGFENVNGTEKSDNNDAALIKNSGDAETVNNDEAESQAQNNELSSKNNEPKIKLGTSEDTLGPDHKIESYFSGGSIQKPEYVVSPSGKKSYQYNIGNEKNSNVKNNQQDQINQQNLEIIFNKNK